MSVLDLRPAAECRYDIVSLGEVMLRLDPGEAADVGPVLDEVHHRLEEWSEIQAVVPSLQHRVELRTDLSRSDVVIDQAGWQAVVAISDGLTVGALGRRLERGSGRSRSRRMVDAHAALALLATLAAAVAFATGFVLLP